MNTYRKEKLINYLFPTVEIAEFLFGDLYVELSKILPKKICFSSSNIKKSCREENLKLATETINSFINDNLGYASRLFELFGEVERSALVKDILIGYIFYCTDNINRNTGADVFMDKRSVCYSKYSILDLI